MEKEGSAVAERLQGERRNSWLPRRSLHTKPFLCSKTRFTQTDWINASNDKNWSGVKFIDIFSVLLLQIFKPDANT